MWLRGGLQWRVGVDFLTEVSMLWVMSRVIETNQTTAVTNIEVLDLRHRLCPTRDPRRSNGGLGFALEEEGCLKRQSTLGRDC
jgi:hypothetical protein